MARRGRHLVLSHQEQDQKTCKKNVSSDPPSSSFWTAIFSLFLACFPISHYINSLPTPPSRLDQRAPASQDLATSQPTPIPRPQPQPRPYSEAPRPPSSSSSNPSSIKLRKGKWTVIAQQTPTTATTPPSSAHPASHENPSSEVPRHVSGSSIKSASIQFRQGKWMASENLASNESIFVQFPPLEEDGETHECIDNSSARQKLMESARNTRESRQGVDNQRPVLEGGLHTAKTPPANGNEKEWYPL